MTNHASAPIARLGLQIPNFTYPGVAFAFTDGAFVEIEALRARRLRHLVQVVNTHLPN